MMLLGNNCESQESQERWLWSSEWTSPCSLAWVSVEDASSAAKVPVTADCHETEPDNQADKRYFFHVVLLYLKCGIISLPTSK